MLSGEEYNLRYFEENGFMRRRCQRCGKYFWTRDIERNRCGDAPCDPYSFIGNSSFRERYTLDGMREEFLTFFERNGHKRIERYPVVARWRDDIYLTIASIADFQPFVTSGQVRPPSNPLVISQPCIRLEDLDSVGKTGRHLTTFEMMAHHAFNYPNEKIYWKDETVAYCDKFLEKLGANLNDVTYKEEPWAGGGNAGPCLEVLLGGLELATLVFMDLRRDDGGEVIIKDEKYRKMDNYIVDTGYGLERFVWASQGSPTIYDAIFPDVIEKIIGETDIEHSIEDPAYSEILAKNAKLSGMMDLDGKRSLEYLRREVSKELGIDLDRLKGIIEPIEKIYAIADYSRCIGYMLGDGIVPSNVKSGYLARLVIRRACRLMDELELKIPLSEIVYEQIGKMPEYLNKMDVIEEILGIERRKYDETIKRGKRIAKKRTRDYKGEEKVPLDTLIDLYDTHGIPPDIVKETLKEDNIVVDVPDNFYSLIAGRHLKSDFQVCEPKIRKHSKDLRSLDTEKEKVKIGEDLPKTEKLYYLQNNFDFGASVLNLIGDYVILDKTLFYPEGGGQPADKGKLVFDAGALDVIDVQSVDGVILHKIDRGSLAGHAEAVNKKPRKGEIIKGVVDEERRAAHTRHHTATHIVLEAAKEVLGDHIWQAGAQKGEDRARLDISHYKKIGEEEIRKIEFIANEIVLSNIKIDARWMDRREAERIYGFSLYQGGVPPGDEIRVVKIGENVQACAGTHCERTGDVGPIKILKVERIQDGVERLEFSAGKAAVKDIQRLEKILKDSASTLKVPIEILPKTVQRFFDEWKELRRDNERLREEISRLVAKDLLKDAINIGGFSVVKRLIKDVGMKELMKISASLTKSKEDNVIAILGDEAGEVVVSMSNNIDELELNASRIVKEVCKAMDGDGGGGSHLARGKGRIDKIGEALEIGVQNLKEAFNEL